MQILHLFWQQTSYEFNNTGCLYLWFEQAKKLNSKLTQTNNHFPYQSDADSLASWFTENFTGFIPRQLINKQFKQIVKIEALSVALPCDRDKQPIPSP
ncbi:MAG: hypothetical protein WBM99_01935, partial [Psychromonas sp.]